MGKLGKLVNKLIKKYPKQLGTIVTLTIGIPAACVFVGLAEHNRRFIEKKEKIKKEYIRIIDTNKDGITSYVEKVRSYRVLERFKKYHFDCHEIFSDIDWTEQEKIIEFYKKNKDVYNLYHHNTDKK